MALPQKGIPAGKSSQDTAVRAAQLWPVPQQGCEAKHFSRNPGEGGLSPTGLGRLGGSRAACGKAGRMPGLAILTVCLNDSGPSYLPLFPEMTVLFSTH